MNLFLCSQLSGPVVQGVADGIQESFDATAPLIAYWDTMTLALASGAELDFMGRIAGYPRPLVPLDFFALNTFHLGDSALWPQNDTATGLGDTDNPTVGGQLGDAFPSVEYTMPDPWYRQIIALMAKLKYWGLTLYTIDLIVGSVATQAGVTYTLTYLANGDIRCTFSSTIDYPLLWILNQAFLKYETAPVVQAVNP